MTCALALGLYAQIPAGDAQPCSSMPTVTDHEGNVYNTVRIGNQCWTKENLRTTTSPSTGTYLIPAANADYTYTGKQARWYYNDSATYAPMNYGLLYNWNAAVDTFNTAYGETSVNTSSIYAVSVTFNGHRRGICPAGWHLPSGAEWTQLTNYVSSQSEYTCGGNSSYIAKALASTEGWNSCSGECYPGDQSVTANNATGFSAVPADDGSSFNYPGNIADFWCATQALPDYYALCRYLGYSYADVARVGISKESGVSVRCLRNLDPSVTTGAVLGVTATTATCGGEVVDDGGFNVTARGICWSTSHNPTIADAHTSNGTGLGEFTGSITGLAHGTTYYVRAYATNSEGTTYGMEKSFITQNPPCPGTPTVTDHEGNVYNTVKIGNQCWTKENLRTTTSPSTGTYLIPTANASPYTYTGKQAFWYDNDSATYAPMNYGLLYNWNAAMDTFNTAYGETSVNDTAGNVVSVTFNGHRRGICPAGWHLPSDAEWNTMEATVSGSDWQTSYETITGYRGFHAGKLACGDKWRLCATDNAPGNMNYANRNVSGFSAVPAGYAPSTAGDDAIFWSSSEGGSYLDRAYFRNLHYDYPRVQRAVSYKTSTYSVRCLRDPGPFVTTGAVLGVTTTTATCGGEVVDDGGASVTARGVCWSTSHNPTVADAHTSNGTGIGSFTGSITGLTPSTTYYVRAYATNSEGTAYGEEVSFVTQNPPCPGVATVTDIDGNVYNTVQLGEQCWMKENLRTTRFADGADILLEASNASNTVPYRYVPNDDPNNVETYGYLYNWAAVMHGANASDANPSGVQGICPAGWHVPSVEEFYQFESYLNSQPVYLCGNSGNATAMAVAATTGWQSSDNDNECTPGYDQSRNNVTGFSALPAGYYYYGVQNYGYGAYFWTASENLNPSYAVSYVINNQSDDMGGFYPYKSHAQSVRCILGEGGSVPLVTTGRISLTGDSTATCTGTVTADGGEDVTVRGICWSWNSSPTLSDNYTEAGSGLGTFTAALTDLYPGVKYYVRAYATNATGTAYGEETFFIVPQCEYPIYLPYSENFDGFTPITTPATGVEPNCWELVQSDVQMTEANRPQLYYKSDYAHSGAYSLLLNYRGVYAMPELSEYTPVRQVKLEMYLRQPKSYYALQVGVWEDNGTFVPVATFNNSGTGLEFVECDFSDYNGNGRRIAFRNISGDNIIRNYSYNYIDDIVLTDVCQGITLPYTEDFDSYTTSTTAATGVEPMCWKLVRPDVQMTDANSPQLYYKSAYAHSGNYSLLLNYRGIYAMPHLSWDMQIPINRVKLEMYVRQPKAYYQLEVGVWNGQMFEPVQRINNSTTEVEKVTVDFSGFEGWGNTIAFRNVLADGYSYNYSYNYIDDITLTEIPEQVCGISELPYTENFDSYTTSTTAATGAEPECWELVRSDVQTMTDANRPQIYYKSTYAHSGAYSLLLNYRGVYAMPELSNEIPLNRVKMEMYLRQPNAAYRLEVGVWDDATQTFEAVQLFNNSTTNVEQVTCDFSGYTGNGRRIAFRNVLGGGANYKYSYNYIDDIMLTEIAYQECGITIPYSEDFDSYTESTTATTGAEPECWELVRSDVQMTDANRPQIYYKSAYAHSGAYSLLLNYRGIYAMPELSDEAEIPLNRVKLEMYLRQPNAAYRLEVGVWDDVTQTFEAVQLFNNSTTNVEQVTCDFSSYTGNGRRIAFRNVLGGGANYKYSYNYIDDVTLTEISYQECGITIPYSEDFDSYTTSTTAATGAEPECWELVQSDVQMTDANRPQIYYKSSYAHSGAYSLLLNYRGIYAMPELSQESQIPLNRVKLEMYLRQPNTAYRLEVGVWDDATQTFETVQLFNNSTTNVEQVTCDFSSYTGNGRRIAFRNVLGGGANYKYSYNYIDDVTLSAIEPSNGCDGRISSLPYEENFDEYTLSTTASTGVEPACWELVQEDVAITETTRPQLYYKSSFAHSGNYSLKMGYRCVYAMPELDADISLNQLTLDMYLRQANAAYQLEVGVWDDETQTFEAVQLFNNSSTNVEHVTCDFANYTGNGHRIAFRNVLADGANFVYSYNYLDDITLVLTANKNAEISNTDANIMDNNRDLVDVIVYPNPTRDYVNVECTMNNVQCSGIEVVDVYGKIITTVDQSTVSVQTPTQINVSGLAAGMYFVRVTTDRGVVTKPFVKR